MADHELRAFKVEKHALIKLLSELQVGLEVERAWREDLQLLICDRAVSLIGEKGKDS